jgi:CRISPR/Cas system-associated exonuclease Cas4 (RecB family)
MTRFNREFHQSDFERFKLCPRMLYYLEILGIEAEKTSEFALAGSAMHETCFKAHTEKLWEEKTLFEFWQEDFEKRIAAALKAGAEVERGTIDSEDYRQMLGGYLAKSWNREAEILLTEKEFFFEIKPSSTIYYFGGRLDQVIRIPREALVCDFPMFEDFPNPQVTLHRDMKTGQRKGTTPFELMLNDQISIYAYGLKYGNFDLDQDGICESHLDLMPDFHALYFLKDHIPYKRPPKDKPIRGPAMYFTKRPLERLRNLPRELMPLCASIRRGDFPREGVARGVCEKHCSVRHYCEADLLQEVS